MYIAKYSIGDIVVVNHPKYYYIVQITNVIKIKLTHGIRYEYNILYGDVTSDFFEHNSENFKHSYLITSVEEEKARML